MTPNIKEAATAPGMANKMRPVLWCADDPESVAIADSLAEHCALEVLETLPEPGKIGTEGNPAAILVLCPSPAKLLCRAMDRDGDPGAALETWRAQLKEILDLNRHNRRAIHVIETAALRRDPGAFLRRYGLSETGDTVEALSQPVSGAPDEIMLVLAWHSLNADIGDRALANEFDAVTVRLTETSPATGEVPRAAFRVYQQRLNERKELELLKDQQKCMFEQAERLYSEKLLAEQRLEQVNSGLESYAAQVQDLQDALEGVRRKLADKEQLLKTVGTVLQDLKRIKDGLAQANGALRQENAELRRTRSTLEQGGAEKDSRIEALTAEMDRIRHSRSYRLTAPLRRMRAALLGKGH